MKTLNTLTGKLNLEKFRIAQIQNQHLIKGGHVSIVPDLNVNNNDDDDDDVSGTGDTQTKTMQQ
ncbi:hypothetical protein ACFQ1M_04700 [Sungkyunkwania multivorans]|uniref:Uncharacterized protein n=1 Tax=Sungkyunkwania multivorans TaxID=1173618 RepID=A0ABW3CWG8_9FLAO